MFEPHVPVQVTNQFTDDPSLVKQAQAATSQSTFAHSSLSLSTLSSFSASSHYNNDASNGDTPIPDSASHPDSTILRKKQLNINYSLVSAFATPITKQDSIPRLSLPMHDWKHIEPALLQQQDATTKKVEEWLQTSGASKYDKDSNLLPHENDVFYDDDEDEDFVDGYVEDSVMLEDDAPLQPNTPPRSPAPITVHIHAPGPSIYIKPALKSTSIQDLSALNHASDIHLATVMNPNNGLKHQDFSSDSSSLLNDQEFQELQQVLQMSLEEAAARNQHLHNSNNVVQHVKFVPIEEVIPSSGEPSETQESIAGSSGIDSEKYIAETKRRTCSQIVVDADEYDEDAALLMAIQISRLEYAERVSNEIRGGGCCSEFPDECLGACGGDCTGMQNVEVEEEQHEKGWKGKERAYY
ncbi:UNVERIFIED_CONTAM: hypothetical protein HDU68_007820 [Siphonaria sp. JEL0065]|nr:hypothetical protein HDU68_007820 [Siphonaria sp. JEL0065]